MHGSCIGVILKFIRGQSMMGHVAFYRTYRYPPAASRTDCVIILAVILTRERAGNHERGRCGQPA